MKLRIFPFQNDIELSEAYIAIFYINNKKLYNRLINTFYAHSIGEIGEEKIVLIEQEKIIDFKDEVLLLTDLWHFDCGHKKITTRLFNYIEENYKADVELMEVFQEQIQKIQIELTDVIDELPFEIEIKEAVTLQDIMKMLGIKVAKLDGLSVVERAINILEIVARFKLYSCVIMCNVKNYLEECELKELYKVALHCKIKLMIVEYGPMQSLLQDEKAWYIDKDYEEFIYR